MKPSERIEEIFDNKKRESRDDTEWLENWVQAVMDYLDEQYEKDKPCKHTNSYQVDSHIGDIYYNVCHDCGVLFMGKEDINS